MQLEKLGEGPAVSLAGIMTASSKTAMQQVPLLVISGSAVSLGLMTLAPSKTPIMTQTPQE